MIQSRTKSISVAPFGSKHKAYFLRCQDSYMNVAEGAYRAGKSITNIFAFAMYLETCEDRLHLVSGYSSASARLNVSDCNGYGLLYLFRGRVKQGQYEKHDCLRLKTKNGEKIVIFAGGGKSDSYKSIQGMSFGSWLGVELPNHYIGNDIDRNFVNMALSRLSQSKKSRVWWDLNPVYEKHRIYTMYIDKFKKAELEGKFVGGYNYENFTLFDNSSLTTEQIAVALNNFGDTSSVAYRRGVMGERAVADGLIFHQFGAERERWIRPVNDLASLPCEYYTIGIDFGKSKSNTAFAATKILQGYKGVAIVADDEIEMKGGGLDSTELRRRFQLFYKKAVALKSNKRLSVIYCDSAEPVMITEIRNALKEIGVTNVEVKGSVKGTVKDRIDCKDILLNHNRWLVADTCGYVIESTATQVWDSRPNHEDERLDDGTCDIDIADAEEYSWSRFIKALLR